MTMGKHKEKPGWNSVPEFGGWDRKTPGATDYSVVFSRARANKKQQKNDVNRHSLGNEQELMVKKQQHQHYQQDDSVMLWKVFNDDTKRNASWMRREEGRGKGKEWVMVGVAVGVAVGMESWRRVSDGGGEKRKKKGLSYFCCIWP
ncbi:hypothetical protein RHGRI_037934 [Rhododendron griersonianum]|uniref:RIN4 pathogenic type III effector avirulence factor Avr cleavage site domain-containing protein n=1 Tax=Rhododendron griersonianum TaxID=479676 RepID=A0AAV6HU64_9ERIC|nr:hypothetical protein RHGRI_037934 [Rhododendron griersonianum]